MADAGGVTEKPMRIFVGGLGAGVTADDMEKTFSSLGSVAAVQLVRTNGRSFGYMDFHPNSDKSLARLFATYNGCMWKGGKLRVENAKEHYLARLSQEWAEDAKLNTTSPTPGDFSVEKNLNTSNKPQTLNQENMQLNIYFPKLRKVKPLPFIGTGKHRYSFQRIEVPPLPIHFCDCEGHSMLSETFSQKYVSCNNSVIHKKELSIMTAVMNKIFKKDGSASDRHTTLDAEANKSVPLANAYMLEESDEASLSDPDNLLTNIGLQQRGDDALDQILLEEAEDPPENQESKSSKLRPSMDGITRTNIKSCKKQHTSSTSAPVNTLEQKSCAVLEEKVAEDDSVPISLGKKTSKNCMKEVEMPAYALPMQTKAERSKNIEPSRGHSWLQKSSWKDLVGELRRSSFSISHVIPGINLVAQKSPISNGSDLDMSAVPKKRKFQFNNELVVKRRKPLAKHAASAHVEKTENDNKVQESPREAPEADPGKKGSISTSIPVDMLDHKFPAMQEGKATEDERMTLSPRKRTPQNFVNEVEMPEDTSVQHQTEPSRNMEPSKGHTWLQKGSWKDLVGEVGNSPFSISHVIPGINSAAHSSPISNGSEFATSTVQKRRKIQSNNEGSTYVEVHKKSLAKQVAPTHVEKTENNDKVQENPEEVTQGEAGKKSNLVPRRIVPKIHVGKVCTFMRNAESEKEWTKAKAVLSGYLKKKGNANDANRNAKGTLRHKA
ncbi:putative RNA recognition motif domain, nucleotide-binding alpha-beta plait domain superfamily [Dioscorea sansibarensis]